MAEEDDLLLGRSLTTRRNLGSIVAAASGLILLVGLVLSSQVPAERHMPSVQMPFGQFEKQSDDWFEASKRRGAAQFRAFACLGFGAVGLLAGLALVFGSNRSGARVLYLDDELRAEAQARGVRRALLDAGLARTQVDPASQQEPTAGYRARAPSADHGDVASRLRKLDDLRTQGLIADEEYAQKRREILGSV